MAHGPTGKNHTKKMPKKVRRLALRSILTDKARGGGLVVIEEKTKKNPITIYAESTPNPAVLKFVANKNLVTSTFEFTSIEDAKLSPFATALFQFPFIKSVFLEKNYVSITKFDVVEWEKITLEIRTFIKTYIEDGKEMVSSTAAV